MADLQDLFARLSGQGTPSPGAAASGAGHAHGYRPPNVSSPIYSPSANGSEPHHASAILSPQSNASPAPEHSSMTHPTPQQQSAQLLNLLRFNSSRSVSQPSIPPHQRPVQRSPSSAGASHPAGLAASIMGKASQPAPQAAPTTSAPAREHGSHSSENPQDLLLRLLNQPKPPQTESPRASFTFASSPPPPAPEMAMDSLAADLANAKLDQAESAPQAAAMTNSPMRVFGSNGAIKPTAFEPEPTAKPIFTYVNPFDKLEAASPRTRTPVGRSTKSPAPKMEILKPKHGLEGATSSHDGKDQPNRKNRKLSPSRSQPQDTVVAEAVASLGPQVDQQVEEALAEAESKADSKPVQPSVRGGEQAEDEAVLEAAKSAGGLSDEDVKAVEELMVETAIDIKKELEDEDAANELKAAVGEPLAETVKEVASEIAQADVADNWESAEAEDSSSKGDEQTVIVYQLPMQPFASINVDNMPQRRATFSPELFMDIARLKKEFDQIDRSLVSATKNFIVYALVKKGGFRIIKQDNGQYRQVFESHQERMFNIAACTGPETKGGVESFLAIGVNGSVFWTSIDPSREDEFSDNLDSHGIVLPPCPMQDDNTSGGQLKTRAKPSSRHPEFFAIGRGKSIHIVWPKIAAQYVQGGKGVVQTERYLKERSLKILTGKAGKDFTFSEDDTVIVSLDKAGRMRFWDIRRLTDQELGKPANPPQLVEVQNTLLEFQTTSPAAKSWPTSVFFFDKDKPFNKGLAARYVMVGMKQNHSFQLWDLGLGKAVQEINLPHEKESDAICSAAFHPRTGIMAVAHPTRNSIFFIHVSCPRYNVPVMSQATYLQHLAGTDDSLPPLPPVNSTAIMTSITEYSFAPKGQIRSIHMLNDPATAPNPDEPESNALFELYAMHSKGVCAVRIRRSDLGWSKESEPLRSKQAKEEGIITVSKLKELLTSEVESSNGGETPRKTTSERSTRESTKKESSNVTRLSMTSEAAMRASTLAKVESKQDAARAAMINGNEKPERKKKKNRAAAAESASQTSSAARAPAASYAQAAQAPPVKSPTPPESMTAEAPSSQSVSSQAPSFRPTDVDAPEWAKKLLGQQPTSKAAPAEFDADKVGELFQTQLATAMDKLYKKVESDRQIATKESNAKQAEIIHLVSQTLTKDAEAVLRQTVQHSVTEVLLPKMLEETNAAIDKSISVRLKAVTGTHIAKEVPEAVSKALNSAQFQKSLAESVTKKATSNIEQVVMSSTSSAISPAIASLSTLIEKRLGDQLRQAEVQRQADAGKISQLMTMVQSLQGTFQSMAANQSKLQAQFAELQQHVARSGQAGEVHRATPAPAQRQAKPQVPQKTPEQLEAEAIHRLLSEGKYEEGTMRWLQSDRTSQLFNDIFVNCNPAYLAGVSPLLNLSTGAVVTDDLDQNLNARLAWLEAVLNNVDPRHPETQDVIPKIMEVMKGRLTQAYIKLNESSTGNPLLPTISNLVRRINSLQQYGGPHGQTRFG